MDELTSTSAFYYSSIFIATSAFCVTLILFLGWPLLAEIPLAICILIQVMAISKTIYGILDENGNQFYEEAATKVKTLFGWLDTQEEKVNIWDNK